MASVLIGWKGYNGVKEGLAGFVDGMVKVIGTDPTTPSEGDLSQLATYKVDPYNPFPFLSGTIGVNTSLEHVHVHNNVRV